MPKEDTISLKLLKNEVEALVEICQGFNLLYFRNEPVETIPYAFWAGE